MSLKELYDHTMIKRELFEQIPLQLGRDSIDTELFEALSNLNKKIIVLDDDPTGVQTVHGVSVFTNWDIKSIAEGFQEQNSLFFILTNSRGLTADESRSQHEVIATTICEVAKQYNKDFLIISRSDSTLRGHYPMETAVLKEIVENKCEFAFDGEVIMPFFEEGERYTINNTHFIGMGDQLTPVGISEFAKDVAFGYQHSNLPLWVEEKTQGQYQAESVIVIGLNELRAKNIDGIVAKLSTVKDFNKVIVNAVNYDDVKVFVISLVKALQIGKLFLFRTAASFVRVIGGIEPRKYLLKQDLIKANTINGGLVIIGSHVKKTTEQFAAIRDLPNTQFIEINPKLIFDENEIANQVEEIVKNVEVLLSSGINAVVYTSRQLLTGLTQEENLRISANVSKLLVQVMQGITVKPKYIIAKGGITSSDIGTKGLGVKKALVAGQILPGIPVWITGDEVIMSNVPYVVFPGNVGGPLALREVMEKLR